MIQDIYGMSDTYFGECSSFLWTLQTRMNSPEPYVASITKEAAWDTYLIKDHEKPIQGLKTSTIMEYTEHNKSIGFTDETDFKGYPKLEDDGSLIIDYDEKPDTDQEGSLLI